MPFFRKKGVARPRPTRGTNKTELAYAAELELQKRAGIIQDYLPECCGLRLADKTFYHPDFLVVAADGTLEWHEVKGFWLDDAKVKFKVAADRFWMYQFVVVQAIPKSKGGGWSVERI